MPKAKPRIVYRTRTVYRDRPEDEQVTTATASVITTQKVNSWIGSITIADIKQWLFIMVPIVAFWWAYLGPLVQSKAEEYVRAQFVAAGVDPENIANLTKTIDEFQARLKEKDEATDKLSSDVQDLKSLLGTVLELQKLQALKGPPPVDEQPVK